MAPKLSDVFPNVQLLAGQPRLGKQTHIGDGALLDCSAPITVGDHTFFGHRVMVLTGSHPYHDKFGPDRIPAAKPRPVTIGTGVWVCSGAIICPGVTIGDHAVVGPGSVVYRNVRPYTVVAGNPARFVKRLRSTTDATQDTTG